MPYIVFSDEEKQALFDEELKLDYNDADDISEDEVDEYEDSLSEAQFFFEDFLNEEMERLTEEEVDEAMTRSVSSTGKVRRRQSRAIRSRRATQTTGRSKSDLRRSGRKAARTKRRDVAGQRKALKKRRKALRRRKSLNIR